ncbi:MAG: 50S ribosomal protein L23 [bacterium]
MTYRQILQARAKKNTQAPTIKKFGPYEIILAPLVTEKSHKQQADLNKYSFKVHADANKNDVKRAVEFIYKISPLDVHIVNMTYKGRSQRKLVRNAYKKAVITLNKKDKIDAGI